MRVEGESEHGSNRVLFSDLLILTNRFDSELNLRVLFKTELCFAFPRKKLTRSHV